MGVPGRKSAETMRNAMEAMSGYHERRLTVSISATGAGMVQTDVSDTGSGLPAQIRDSVRTL